MSNANAYLNENLRFFLVTWIPVYRNIRALMSKSVIFYNFHLLILLYFV